MRRLRTAIELVLILSLSGFSVGCRSSEQVIEFSRVPVADVGGPDGLELIQGRVLRAKPDQRIVLYAHSTGLWWLQPASSRPFTEIKPDRTWQSIVHLGD